MNTDSKPDPKTGVNECDHWIAIAYDGWGGDVFTLTWGNLVVQEMIPNVSGRQHDLLEMPM